MEALERGIAVNRRWAAERLEQPPNREEPASWERPAPVRFEQNPLQEDGRH